jgi:hypothetical protein
MQTTRPALACATPATETPPQRCGCIQNPQHEETTTAIGPVSRASREFTGRAAGGAPSGRGGGMACMRAAEATRTTCSLRRMAQVQAILSLYIISDCIRGLGAAL